MCADNDWVGRKIMNPGAVDTKPYCTINEPKGGLYDASKFMYCADNESEGLLPLADPPITELLLLLLITTEIFLAPSILHYCRFNVWYCIGIPHTHMKKYTSFTG